MNLGDSPILGQVITTKRTPMNNDQGSTDSVAYLKNVDDKKDRTADWPSDADTSGDMTEHRLLEKRNEIGNALLVIYVIDKDSTPNPPPPGKLSRRKKLEAIDHQVALAFAFPSAHKDTEIPDAFVVDSQYLPEFELEGAEDDDIAVTDDDGDQICPRMRMPELNLEPLFLLAQVDAPNQDEAIQTFGVGQSVDTGEILVGADYQGVRYLLVPMVMKKEL